MTREEADKLQKFIDEYVELRDKAPAASAMDKGPRAERRSIVEEVSERLSKESSAQIEDKFRKLRDKARAAMTPERRAYIIKMNLAQYIEPTLPEVKVGGSMDLMGLAGPISSLLGLKFEEKDCVISVVDGHDDIDPDDIGWEEYERLYCVRVPGDVMKEAMNVRSLKAMFEMGKEIEEER